MRFSPLKTISKIALALLLSLPAHAGFVDLGGAAGIPTSEKGAPNGVASLDGTGKVPAAQLPGGGGGGSVTTVSVVSANGFTGTVANATTTPAITIRTSITGILKGDGTAISAATSGTDYLAPFAGASTDYVRGNNTTAVLDTSVVPENTNLYYTNARFDTRLGTKTTDDLTEGATNLYFTNARAKSAAVADAIVDGVTDVAASQNAIYDALVLKADAASVWSTTGNAGTTAGTNFIGTTDAQDVIVKRNSVTKMTVGNATTISANVMQVPDGNASAPGLRLTTDSDTGLFQSGDGNLSIAANGAIKISVDQNSTTFSTKASGTIFESTQFQAPATFSTSILTDAGTQVTYDAAGGWYSSQSIVPADATGKNQYSLRTYVDPTVSTTGASHTGLENQLVWDNGNGGYGNTSGNLLSSQFVFTHNGSGNINYASTISGSANFNSTGTTGQFKGVTSENGIASGATVSDYYGMVSGLNTTGGIVPASSGISQYGNFTDATIGNATGVNQNLTFSGTTANSQGATGVNSYLQFNNSTTTTNSAYGFSLGIDLNDTATVNGLYGTNAYMNVRDGSNAGSVNGFNFGYNQEDTSVTTGSTGVNLNMQYSGTSAAANASGVSAYIRTYGNANLDSVTMYQTNPELEGSSTVDNVNIANFGGQFRGSAVFQNINGIYFSGQMSGSAAADNFIPFSLTPTITGSATLTNGWTIANISPTADNTAGVSAATGLNINMSNVDLSAAALAAGERLKALTFEGSIEGGGTNTVPGAATYYQNHYIGGTVNVASGDPASTFGFGTNLAQTVNFQDDWTDGGSGLGFVNVGFVGSLIGGAGKTMYKWTGALGGAGNPSGSGTITNAIMYSAAGILPQGGSLAVTNMYGFEVNSTTFCAIGTNCWGFYEDGASSTENHMSKLAIGTSTKKVANTDTALEIGNSKQLIIGRGTTATKNALTAVEGAFFYDTTLQLPQWYDGAAWQTFAGGGGGSVTTVSVASANGFAGSVANATTTPAITISTSITGMIKGNGTAISAATAGVDYVTPKISVVDGGDAAYTILATDNHVRTTTTLTANRTYTLPACAGGNVGEHHFIKNLPAQTFDIILEGDTTDTIDGAANFTIYPGNSVQVVCAAAGEWDIQ